MTKQVKQNSPIIDNTIVELDIPWSTVKPVHEETLTKLAKKVKVDGFRKGKAPVSVIKSQLDYSAVVGEVLDKVLPKLYTNLITEKKLQPICDPEFEPLKFEEGQDWSLNVIIAEKQPVELGNYQKIVKEAKKEAQKSDKKDKKKNDQKQDDKKTVEQHTLQTIYQYLVKAIEPKVPVLLLKKQTQQELRHLVKRLESMKLSLDDYLKKTNQSFEQLSQQMAVFGLGKIQLEMIFEAVVQKEKITVQKEELDKAIKALPDSQKNNPQFLSLIQASLREQKVIEHLLGIK